MTPQQSSCQLSKGHSSTPSAREQTQSAICTTSSPTLRELLCYAGLQPQADVRLMQYNSNIQRFFWHVLTISKSYSRKKMEPQWADLAQWTSSTGAGWETLPHLSLCSAPTRRMLDLEAALHMGATCIIPLPCKQRRAIFMKHV